MISELQYDFLSCYEEIDECGFCSYLFDCEYILSESLEDSKDFMLSLYEMITNETELHDIAQFEDILEQIIFFLNTKPIGSYDKMCLACCSTKYRLQKIIDKLNTAKRTVQKISAMMKMEDIYHLVMVAMDQLGIKISELAEKNAC